MYQIQCGSCKKILDSHLVVFDAALLELSTKLGDHLARVHPKSLLALQQATMRLSGLGGWLMGMQQVEFIGDMKERMEKYYSEQVDVVLELLGIEEEVTIPMKPEPGEPEPEPPTPPAAA